MGKLGFRIIIFNLLEKKMKTDQINNIAILGAGKIGQAIAKGMILSGKPIN